MKTCSKCGESKPVDDFGLDRSAKDGRRYHCRQCARQYARDYYRRRPEVAAEATKRWRKAHPERAAEVHRNSYQRQRMTPEAVEKDRATQRERRAANPERVAEYNRRNRAKRLESGKEREYRLQADYGIGVAEYDALMAKQGERCPICDRSLTDGRVKPVVDHCHDSGQVRGILCNGCNMHLGWFEARQKAARAYLKGC